MNGYHTTYYLQTTVYDGDSGGPWATTVKIEQALNDGQWHHVAATMSISGGTTTFTPFLDGSPASSDTLAMASLDFLTLSLFREYDDSLAGSAVDYEGLFDEFAIWDRALSPEEIATIHDLGLQGKPIPEPTSALLLLLGLPFVIWRKRR